MHFKDLFPGGLVIVFVLGAYFLGAFHGQRASIKWSEFFASLTRSLTWRGFIWATAFPTCWLLLFYTLVVSSRLSLGRWPEFGHQFGGWWFAFLGQTTWNGAGALIGSLFLMPVILIACLFFRSWRHVSVYAIAYAAAVGVAIGTMSLAPHQFLNWYMD